MPLRWKAAAVGHAGGSFVVHWVSLWSKVGSDGAEAWVGGLHCLAGEGVFVGMVVVPGFCPRVRDVTMLFGFCGGQLEEGERALLF